MYDFLYQLTKNQLNNLLSCTTDENLKVAIKKVLFNKGDIEENYLNFLSERSNYENDELLTRYNDISNSLNINSLDFLTKLTYRDKGNNIGTSVWHHYLDTAAFLYENEEIRKLLALYNIRNFDKFYSLFLFYGFPSDIKSGEYESFDEFMERKEIKDELEKLRYFSYLDNFFKNEEMIKKYEGVFNTYMYIREYIFSKLSTSQTFSKDNLFDDFDEKTQIVIDNFKDICSYLLSVRESINGLRLSFGNIKIAYNSRKDDKEFTDYQKLFINGLAFGTTLEKLENGDYTDLSRIIYLPKNKVYQLSNK